MQGFVGVHMHIFTLESIFLLQVLRHFLRSLVGFVCWESVDKYPGLDIQLFFAVLCKCPALLSSDEVAFVPRNM